MVRLIKTWVLGSEGFHLDWDQRTVIATDPDPHSFRPKLDKRQLTNGFKAENRPEKCYFNKTKMKLKKERLIKSNINGCHFWSNTYGHTHPRMTDRTVLYELKITVSSLQDHHSKNQKAAKTNQCANERFTRKPDALTNQLSVLNTRTQAVLFLLVHTLESVKPPSHSHSIWYTLRPHKRWFAATSTVKFEEKVGKKNVKRCLGQCENVFPYKNRFHPKMICIGKKYAKRHTRSTTQLWYVYVCTLKRKRQR